MNLTLSDEQQMLREAATNALGRVDTVNGAREARDGSPLPTTWATAVEAGWTGLLLDDAAGGAGLDLFDAMLVAEECGKRLAGAHLYGHFAATYMLQLGQADPAVLGSLASGDLRAAAAVARPPGEGETAWTVDGGDGQRIAAPRATVDGESARLTGVVKAVPDLSGADIFVVVACDASDQPLCVLVDGVEATEVVRFDASRPLGELVLDDVEGRIVGGGPEAEAGWYALQALLAADALGVCQAVLDMGVEYACDRHTFGRPIGSYQAVKHQLVEILRWIDITRNLCYYTGYAAQEKPEELALAASSARFAAEQASDYATRTCIAVHGGIGATWEHDAPFYWRRAQLSRLLLGGLDDAGDRVAGEIIASARRVSAAGAR